MSSLKRVRARKEHTHMGKRWQKGGKLQASDWLGFLHPYLGDLSKEFQCMLKGAVTDLSDTFVIQKDWGLCSSMQEILGFGFDKSRTNTRIVSGLVHGSRSALAGLENGDQILFTSRASLCSTSLYEDFELIFQGRQERAHFILAAPIYAGCGFSLGTGTGRTTRQIKQREGSLQ
jgi:hypothetical protein